MTMINRTVIHNVTITLFAAFLSFPGWAEDQAPSASEATPAAVAPQASDAAPSSSTAETPAANTADLLREDHPDQYKVVKGDTLWEIANRFLKDPWMWPEIWHVNPQIANPHLIYPGDTVKLIYLEGQPRLTVKRGEEGMTYKVSPESQTSTTDAASEVASSSSMSSSTSATESSTQNQAPDSNARSGDQKLHPSIRVMPLEEPIPAIPLNIIDPFLSGSRVVSSGVLDAAPYVVQGSQSHVITGSGGELYVRGKFDAKTSIYGIFRKGKAYIDPETKEVLGIQAIDIGTGRVKAQEKDIARLNIVRSTQEIRAGDRLLVNQERRVESTFFPSAPEANIRAEIIDVEGGVSQVGAMSVVAINKGERDELQSGNVLAIFQRGGIVHDRVADEDIRLLDERAGLVMIFVTFEKMSYGLVLYADRPLRVGDYARKP